MAEVSPSLDPDSCAARLRWRCRRGMLELDVLLTKYVEHRYPVAPPGERRAFESLLDLQDPQLLALVMGWDVPVEPDLRDVIARLTCSDV